MTIDPGEPTPPSPEDEPRRQGPGKRRGAHGVIGLADKIVTSWSNTSRFLLVAVVLVGLIIFGLRLLSLDLSVGPFHIGRVQMHVQPSSAAR